MKGFSRLIQQALEHPVRIAGLSLAFAFLCLLVDGTLINLWKLNRQTLKIQNHFDEMIRQNGDLKMKIQEATHSDKFIGRQARERLDLLKDDELVFIFENESPQ